MLSRLAFRLLHVMNRLTRPLTMGVRCVVIDKQDRVFLVRHSYVPGWHFPGGGVEPGESVMESLKRELHEEGNIDLTGLPKLHGVFFNTGGTIRDHVVFYVAHEWKQDSAPKPGLEIVESGFFPRNALPENAARYVRDRLKEIFEGAPISERL